MLDGGKVKLIGIITSSCGKSGNYGLNYGAALQGFALVQVLRKNGYDAYDINYVSDNEYRPQQYNVIKRSLIRFKLLFNIKLVKNKIQEIKERENEKILLEEFKDFVKKYSLTYNNGAFYTLKELKKISPEFHAFVTGSDVVWNPYLHKMINDKGYFLDFAQDGVKRVAYAPSFGCSSLPDSARTDLKSLLEKFDGLSVREKTGSDIIKETTGLDVPVVLDPTLLPSKVDYEEMLTVPINLPEKYIAVYRFGTLDHTINSIKEISKKYNLPIVYIPSNNDGKFETKYDISPSDFVGVIKNAELVLTDSFHCSVFSVIFNKPFLCFFRTKPSSNGSDLNSRVVDFLHYIGLEERLVPPEKKIPYDTLFEIDYDKVNQHIESLRKTSLEYLLNSLEK